MVGLRIGKFTVRHHSRGPVADGDCFVLVPSRDPAAVRAIRAYVEATSDPVLAAELAKWMDQLEGVESREPSAVVQHRIRLWTGILAVEVRNGSMALEVALQRMGGHVADLMRSRGES